MKLNRKNLLIIFIVAGVVAFFYFNRHHRLSAFIQSDGSASILAAILAMALMCLTPLPSEGLLLVFYNVFGIVMGSIYAWSGYVLSTLLIFVVARYFSTNFIRKKIANSRFEAVDRWIGERSIAGLLIVRILPIPAFIVNCVLGTMPSVSFLKYWFTAIVAILPYYITSSCLYLGVTTAHYSIILIGAFVGLIMWFIGWTFKRKNRESS